MMVISKNNGVKEKVLSVLSILGFGLFLVLLLGIGFYSGKIILSIGGDFFKFLYYGSVLTAITSLGCFIIFGLFVLDAVLFFRRKKSFIWVYIILLASVLIYYYSFTQVTGMKLGGMGPQIYTLTLPFFLISIYYLLVSKRIKSYLGDK